MGGHLGEFYLVVKNNAFVNFCFILFWWWLFICVCVWVETGGAQMLMLKLGGNKNLSSSLGIDVFVLVAECAVHRASAIHDNLG